MYIWKGRNEKERQAGGGDEERRTEKRRRGGRRRGAWGASGSCSVRLLGWTPTLGVNAVLIS